jgi:anthranilate/para-aminobenzoate synthase component I
MDFEKGTTTFYSEHGEEDLGRMALALSVSNNQLSTENKKKPRAALSRPSFKKFQRMVRRAQDAIRRGDIYQANLSLRFSGRYHGDPLFLYRRLCESNPSPYAGIWKTPTSWVVSNSPELLVRVENKEVVTRPIAGTRPRGGTAAMDRKRSGQLLLSPKERAEHIMLVDLERNDLGRVCQAGSVTVTDRYAIEKYSHVMHIVSEVRGRLKPRASAIDVLRATFPGGTITGCPKIKSVEVIEALEKQARGIFYGSGGFFRANGDATFNILIRTAFVKGERLYIQAGAGIVADSQPRREYNEVLAKAQALREAVEKS